MAVAVAVEVADAVVAAAELLDSSLDDCRS